MAQKWKSPWRDPRKPHYWLIVAGMLIVIVGFIIIGFLAVTGSGVVDGPPDGIVEGPPPPDTGPTATPTGPTQPTSPGPSSSTTTTTTTAGPPAGPLHPPTDAYPFLWPTCGLRNET